MTLYDKTVAFVDAAFKNERQKKHFQRTVFWLEKFLSKITEAHRIAAYAHDIERGITGERDKDYLNPVFLRQHQEEGARIMKEFLQREDADQKTIDTVQHLISKHEEGGDVEQDALMNADSVSYFEANAEMFVRERAKKEGYAKIKGKLDWMFNRITSPQAKEAALENYEKWSAELETYK